MIWFTSDHHFNHENILMWKTYEGKPLRDFSSVEEMNETMIERWNSVVQPRDKVYMLGDVGFGDRKLLPTILSRLKGSKRLCLGNHDNGKDPLFLACFQKVSLWRFFKEEGFIVTHVPMRDDQFRFKVPLCVHGHIHSNPDPSPFHMNVSVEVTDYTPVPMDVIVDRVKHTPWKDIGETQP